MKWENMKLGKISNVDWGNTSLTKSAYVEDGEFLAVSAAGCDGRIAHFEHSQETTVISAIGANCGVVFFPNEKFTAIKNTMTVTPKSGVVHPKYLYWFLSTAKFKVRGAGQPFLSKGDTEELDVPLPPLHIQEQIADTLDKADALRRKDQELLQKYDELAQAIFYDMFGDPVKNEKGWKTSTLEGLINIDTKSVKPEDTVGRHYVGLENIEKESGNVTQSKEVDLKSNKFLFDPTCILYGKLRPYLRKVATPNFDGVCSTDIFPIRCQGLEKEFAATILRSEHFTDYAISSSVGANLPRVNKEVILSYQTICPPMSLQENYSVKINQIKQLKAVVNTSRVAHENMQSVLFKRFFS
jgi:type I restriction enzyme S subunit